MEYKKTAFKDLPRKAQIIIIKTSLFIMSLPFMAKGIIYLVQKYL